jgi:Ser/Thr protein kinase RdoA (MazF antagonist)
MLELREIPDAWGLIHADLHLSNNVFQSARACPIDFDDCGFGSHVYDAVVAVHFHFDSPHFRAFLSALREGYKRVCRFPSEGLPLVPSLIAMRSASVAIWIASQVDENARYQELFSTYVDRLMVDVRSLADGTVSEWLP